MTIAKAEADMNAPQRQDQFFSFNNSYTQLPDRFYTRLPPTPVRSPKLIKLNRELAERLALDPERLTSPEGIEVLAGNRLPVGADPIAMAYAGHQFGSWVPQLGDGRAILLGEVADRIRHEVRHPAQGCRPERPIPEWATAGPLSDRSFASTLSARQWRHLGFPRPGHLPPLSPAKA